MNIFQRFALAFRITISGTRALATVLPAWRENQPEYTEVRYENMVREGWRRNELIFACISKTANTSRALSLQITNRDGKVLPDHAARRLLSRPNPYMNESDLWASVIIFLKLAGVAYYEKERSAAGRVVGLWPLRPDWVRPILSSRGIAGYEYSPPGMQPVPIAVEDVLRFSLFDPKGLFKHWPPVAVAARSGDADNAVTDYLKLFFDEGGVPPGVFTTDQALTEDDISRIRKAWRERYGGWKNWKDPIVLGSGAKYQATGASAVNTGWDVLDMRNEARICMALDVPPIVVGAQVGLMRSTFANYGEARQSWWEDSILPMFENFMDTIQNGILAEFGSDLGAKWDTANVPALRAVRIELRNQALNELKSGAITRNQFNEMADLENLGPRGDVFMMPINVVEVPIGQLAGANGRMLPLGASHVLPAYTGNGHQHIHIESPADQRKQLPPDNAERRKIERQLEHDASQYFEDLLDAVMQQVRDRVGEPV